MEHKKCKEVRQSILQFRCEKVPHAEKSGDGTVADIQITKSDKKQDYGFSLSSPTPERIIQSPRTRKSKEHHYNFRTEADNSKKLPDVGGNSKFTGETHENGEWRDVSSPKALQHDPYFSTQSLEGETSQLSEKYKVMSELFDKMIISVRLLGLRKRLPSFQNISTQVEILAKKKFVLSHLAQMKYLFPEAIHIEKILIHDGTSLCMKPDIKVSLILYAAKDLDDSRQSPYVDLRQCFHSRLMDFFNMHPEETEIPEAPLPDSFSQGNSTTSSNVGPSMEQPWSASVDDDPLLHASHLCASFSEHFSQRILDPEKQMAEPCDSSISMISTDPIDECNEEIKNHIENDNPHPLPHNRPLTEMNTCSHYHQKTPMKLTSTPVKLMIETPVLSTPKRPAARHDVKLLNQTVTPNHSARRSLIYSPSKSDKSGSDSIADITDSLCYKIPCSQEGDAKRSLSKDETNGYCATDLRMSQENATVLANHRDRGPVHFDKRQEMLASLPDLFNTISFIFSSKDCTSITKQELVHKILSYNCDIDDTDEVEEQLQLLEELVPDWICGKTMSSGDLMYSISRAPDPKSVRARLIEAV